MPHGIYQPEDAAQFFSDQVGQKWRPSNGTEGEIFISSWCFECQRDSEQDCPIVAATFIYDVDDEKYPQQWQYGADGQPKCTEWIPLGDPLPTPRCTETRDMFDKDESPE